MSLPRSIWVGTHCTVGRRDLSPGAGLCRCVTAATTVSFRPASAKGRCSDGLSRGSRPLAPARGSVRPRHQSYSGGRVPRRRRLRRDDHRQPSACTAARLERTMPHGEVHRLRLCAVCGPSTASTSRRRTTIGRSHSAWLAFGFVYEINYLRCLHCVCVSRRPRRQSREQVVRFPSRSQGASTPRVNWSSTTQPVRSAAWEDWRDVRGSAATAGCGHLAIRRAAFIGEFG